MGELVGQAFMVSSAFVHWEGEGEGGERKGRFVQNFKRMSKWWGVGSVKMERAAEFAAEVQPEDQFVSFDVSAVYRHFFLHPGARNFFLFHYAGQFFRYIALPFGWSRSAWWFVKLMAPFAER